MIVMSNNNSNEELTLADEMRIRSESMNLDKFFLLKDKFDSELKRHAHMGNRSMDFIVLENSKGFFMNEPMVKKLQEYIISNGFKLDLQYISEEDIIDSFYLFRVEW